MTEASERVIVVGLDNTPGAAAALRWAITRANRVGAVVRAVHAIELPGSAASLENDVAGTRATVQGHAHTWAARALAGSTSHAPVTVELRDGDPATVLSRAARGAETLVLGTNAGNTPSPLTDCVVPTRCELVVVDETGERQPTRQRSRRIDDLRV